MLGARAKAQGTSFISVGTADCRRDRPDLIFDSCLCYACASEAPAGKALTALGPTGKRSGSTLAVQGVRASQFCNQQVTSLRVRAPAGLTCPTVQTGSRVASNGIDPHRRNEYFLHKSALIRSHSVAQMKIDAAGLKPCTDNQVMTE